MRGFVRPAALGAAFVGSLGGAGTAAACSFAGSPTHVVDPAMQATDKVAPVLEPPSAGIARGTGRGLLGCSEPSTCDEFGIIHLNVAASDDATPADRIGYRITFVSGTLPDEFELPAEARRQNERGGLLLIWYDEPEVAQEPFDFTVEVVAIDLAGNESAPQMLRLSDGGNDGCRAAGRRGAPADARTAAVLIAMTALAVRRRRGRPGGRP